MKQKIKNVSINKTCQLCRSSEDNELRYGKLFIYKDLVVHHFCLLFAPACPQNGKDHEGIEGFLVEDIKKEIKRVKLLICCFCGKKGANLGCEYEQHYSGSYHTKCAWKNNVSFQFTSSFKTYCKKHNILKQTSAKPSDCKICFEEIEKKEKFRAILMPCCKNTWFHRDCLQQYALNAGVFFKCPLCNEKDKIQNLKEQGIFIPERDALWELEENAFSEFYQPPHLNCESYKCMNKLKHADKVYMWKLCHFCGANGVHIKCFERDAANDIFTCSECSFVLSYTENKENVPQMKEEKKKRATWISDEEVFDSDDEVMPSPPKKKRILRNKKKIY